MPEEEQNKSALEKLQEKLLSMWKQSGKASIITGRHTEFVVEPKVIMGTKLHPDILKVIVLNYLYNTSKQDSGTGNIEASPERLVIKGADGKKLIVVRDKQIIQQYIASRA